MVLRKMIQGYDGVEEDPHFKHANLFRGAPGSHLIA